MIRHFARLAARFEFDRTVAWALGIRFWQLLAGPVTALLIAARFSESEQDYFYTLTGLLGLDAVCNLGLNEVLVALVAHERAGGETGGASRRLAGLTRFAGRWAGLSAAAFAVGVGAFGAWTFAGSEPPPDAVGPPVGWAGPWALAALATAGSVAVGPALAVLTGCGRVRPVARAQTLAAVAGNLGMWAVLLAGGSLWAAAAACVARLAVEAGLLVRSRAFLSGLARGENRSGGFQPPIRSEASTPAPQRSAAGSRRYDTANGGVEEETPPFRWAAAVWPMQWRAAVQSAAAALAAASLTLVLFRHRDALGAGEAGRMGMSWSAATALQYVGVAWLGTRLPRLGALAAAGDRGGFDRLFRRVFLVSLAALIAGAAVGTAAVWGLNRLGLPLADRLLPPAPFAALVGGSVLAHVPLSLAAYARAWRAEAFVLPAVLLWAAVGFAALALGPRYGAAGVAWGYCGAVGGVGVPLFAWRWRRWRRRRDRP